MNKNEILNRMKKDNYCTNFSEETYCDISNYVMEKTGFKLPGETFDANDSEKTDDYDFEDMMNDIVFGDEYAEDLADTYEAEYDEKPEVCPEFEHIGKYIEKIDGYDWQHDTIANTKMTSDEIDDYLCGMSKTEMMKWLYVLYDMRNIERTDGYCEFVVRNPEWIARRVKTICALTNELDNAAMIVAVLYNYVREVADALNERIFMNTEE